MFTGRQVTAITVHDSTTMSTGQSKPHYAEALPDILQSAVLGESEEMPEGSIPVRGYDFNDGVDLDALLSSLATTGFQASNFGLAIEDTMHTQPHSRTAHARVRDD